MSALVPSAPVREIIEGWIAEHGAGGVADLLVSAGAYTSAETARRHLTRLRVGEYPNVRLSTVDTLLCAMDEPGRLNDIAPVATNPTGGSQAWRFTSKQGAAIAKLYRAGLAMADIARLCWKQSGFPSERAAYAAIRRALVRNGVPRRSKSEARRLLLADTRCIGCGCELEQRTISCSDCRTRHYRRRIAGRSYLLGRGRVGCTGCGCPPSERTVGCSSCRSRHYMRQRRGAQRLQKEAA